MAINIVTRIVELREELAEIVHEVRDRITTAGNLFLASDEGGATTFIADYPQTAARIVKFHDECVVAIARYQPVACDLHDIMTLYRMGHDVDRMTKLSLSVAKKTLKVATYEPVSDQATMHAELVDQMARVETMLDCCQTLLTTLDRSLVSRITQLTDEVATIKQRLKHMTEHHAYERPDDTSAIFYLFAISRHYDRIADLICAVSEATTSLRA